MIRRLLRKSPEQQAAYLKERATKRDARLARQKRDADVIAAIRRGDRPIKEIAREHGISYTLTNTIAKSAGLTVRKDARSKRDKEIAAAVAIGTSLKDIAKKHDISVANVRRVARKAPAKNRIRRDKVASVRHPLSIERDVPLPPEAVFPLDQMQVGDSFLAPARVAKAAVKAVAANPKFITRPVEGGVRVWRIA